MPAPPNAVAGVETLLGVYRAEDYGAHALPRFTDASGGLNIALAIASVAGGGPVSLDAGLTYQVARTVTVPSRVELIIPAGTTLQAGPGLNGDVVATAAGAVGVRMTGGGTIDCRRPTGGQAAGNGVTFNGASDCALIGPTIQNAYQDGIALLNCTRVTIDGQVAANGRHGVYHSGSTFCTGRIISRDNGQRVAGQGVAYDAASTDNAYALLSTDTRVGGAKTQQYGMWENPATGCNRNTLSGGSSLTGNAAGALSLDGAASGYVAGAPTGVAGGQLAGNYPNPTVAGPVASASLAGYPWHNADLATDVARANQLVNSGFEFWLRGNGPFTTSVYGPDRWQLQLQGTDTLSVSKDTVNVVPNSGSNACAACTFTLGTGGGLTNIEQILKQADGYQFAGRTVTFSVMVRTATANAVRVGLQTDGTGGVVTYGASYHSGDGLYHVLSVTVTVPANATTMWLYVLFSAACTAYVDNAMLVPGSVAADYVPLPPADELARCQRYYERLADDGDATLLTWGNAAGAGAPIRGLFPFKTAKAVVPTITRVGTWGLNNANGQPVASSVGTKGLYLSIVSTAAGDSYAYNNAAGNNLTAEANP